MSEQVEWDADVPPVLRRVLEDLIYAAGSDEEGPIVTFARLLEVPTPALSWTQEIDLWIRDNVNNLDARRVYEFVQRLSAGSGRNDQRINSSLTDRGINLEIVDGVFYRTSGESIDQLPQSTESKIYPGSQGFRASTQGEVTGMAGNSIFISHASADSPLADLLQQALILGGIPQNQIFYSSARSTGIPAGDDVRAHLRQSLHSAGLVIELLSQTFLTRPICLMELGAAWVTETPTFPIVIPPLDVDSAVRAVGNVHMLPLAREGSNQAIFDELQDRIRADINFNIFASQWGQGVAYFNTNIASAFSSIGSPSAEAIPESAGPESPKPSSEEDGEFSFSGIVVNGSRMHGEATNQDSVKHSAIMAATFYDANNTIIGTEQTVVSDVRPGQSRTFTFNNVPGHTRYKIEVSTLL